MKELNTYERMLIKEHINPSICYMTSGLNWEYLNKLRNKFGARISILGNNPENNCKDVASKTYDVIVLETERALSDSFLNCLFDTAYFVSQNSNELVSCVYSFSNGKGTRACQFIYDGDNFHDLGYSDGYFEARDLLNLGVSNRENYVDSLENVKKR